MELKLAGIDDLPQIKSIYKKIVNHMNENNISIWDEIYPSEFFYEDIRNNHLYILVEEHDIVAVFALCESSSGENNVVWENKYAKGLYIDRFGVNVNYLRRGIGSKMLNKAAELARDKGVEYLRLFVVDINEPAIQLYLKNGFKRVEGIYNEIIDDELVLREYGFEKRIS